MADDMKQLTLIPECKGSLTKRADSKIKLALSDRLTPSETIEAVTRMLAGYANADKRANSYIGLMASIFSKYPRSVVLRAVEPDGIPLTTKFIPTPADVIGWLEAHVRWMHEESAREDRIVAQLAARDEWLKPSDQDVSAQRKALADDWLQRHDPRVVELSGQTPKGAPSAEEIERLMASARKAASTISGGDLKLSQEARDGMAESAKSRAMDG